MNRSFILLLFVLPAILSNSKAGFSQNNYPLKSYQAFEIKSAPTIDGKLDEEVWEQGEWQGQFVQYEPNNGELPLQETHFKLFFDQNNIYVGIQCLDSAPDSIVKRAVRRDYSGGDFAGVIFDSYNDHRTCFILGADVMGVKYDAIIFDNGDGIDPSWDPVWWVACSESESGWFLEMRVPLSQLRFKGESQDNWGLQVYRRIHRHSEQDFWQAIDKESSGFVEHFGHLSGLTSVKPSRLADITPYAVAQYDRYPKETGNPFRSGSDLTPRMGLDGKLGITNNMTLDLSINPDFGQVEADPSRVNLTAFETFFQEKRPFFVEGGNITQFGIGDGDGGLGNDNLFYSRRIGRRPQYEYLCKEGEYVNSPLFTPILGAVKLSGKTEKGLSVGLIESVSDRVLAEVYTGEDSILVAAEPFTNYFVGRIHQDFQKGNTMIGGILTGTNRLLNDDHLKNLISEAYTGGLDFTQYFKERSWRISTNTAFSYISGSKEAIMEAQTSSARYLQRPDAHHVSVDSTLQSLTGTGGRIELDKLSGHWNVHLAFLWKSPKFEVNDLGFNGDMTFGFQNNRNIRILTAQMIYRVTDRLELRFFPANQKIYNQLQYVSHCRSEQVDRYIFSSINQTITSLPIRFNLVISPNMTLQYWGQPFFAKADFFEFKYISDPDADDYENRFINYQADQIQEHEDGLISIDDNHDGVPDFEFYSPDFKISEFLSNMVFRWEYIPGSSLYLVWSQQSKVLLDLEKGMKIVDIKEMNYGLNNYFQLKISYRLGR